MEPERTRYHQDASSGSFGCRARIYRSSCSKRVADTRFRKSDFSWSVMDANASLVTKTCWMNEQREIFAQWKTQSVAVTQPKSQTHIFRASFSDLHHPQGLARRVIPIMNPAKIGKLHHAFLHRRCPWHHCTAVCALTQRVISVRVAGASGLGPQLSHDNHGCNMLAVLTRPSLADRADCASFFLYPRNTEISSASDTVVMDTIGVT